MGYIAEFLLRSGLSMEMMQLKRELHAECSLWVSGSSTDNVERCFLSHLVAGK